MDVSSVERLWGRGAVTAAALNQYPETKPSLLDDAADAHAARAVSTWLGLHCKVDSCTTQTLVANGGTLIEECRRGVTRGFDPVRTRGGVDGCHAMIADVLKEFEEQCGVRVVHATECGSRMFGWGSHDSDFDIKLVYCYPPERYACLPVRERGSTLQYMAWANLHTAAPVDVTIAAYDLPYFLELYRDSNPTALDCVCSPVVWQTVPGFVEALRDLAVDHFAVAKFIHARLSVVRQTAKKHLDIELDPRKEMFAAKAAKRKLRRAQESPANAVEGGDDAVGAADATTDSNNNKSNSTPITHIKPKEYVIMLRSIADVLLTLRAAGVGKDGSPVDGGRGATAFPPPLPFNVLWACHCRDADVVPADVTAWVARFLDVKTCTSKYAPHNESIPRVPAVERYLFDAYASVTAALGDDAVVARLPTRRAMPLAALNDVLLRVLRAKG